MGEQVLSRADCENVLIRYLDNENFELLDYSLRPLSENVEGFLGDHMWLTLHYKKENGEFSQTFFLKTEPTQYEMQVEFARHINAFNNETCFYLKLVPEFKKYYENFDDTIYPKFYLSKGSYVVVIENLAEHNYKNADTLDVMDMNHIKFLLQAFAKLHAASIIYEERKSEELGREYRLTDEYKEYLEETFFQRSPSHLGSHFAECSEKCILQIIDLMPECDDISKEEFKQKFSEFADSCFELSHASKQFRNVLCHADMWRKNVMFKYENDKPVQYKLLDFQLMKYSPPIYDVMKCVYQVTSSEMRQHYLDDILDYYYNNLCKELKLGNICAKTVLPYDDFILSAKHLLPYILVEATYYYTFQKLSPEYLKELFGDQEAYKDHVFRDRSEIVRRFYKPGTYFQTWMDEIILEIKDVISHDGFSKQDCRTLLKNRLNSTNYELIKYSISKLEEQNGFLGDHKKINVSIQQNGQQKQLNFFAKFLPTTEFSLFVIESRAFDNEKFMYDHVFKRMAEFDIDIYDCVAKSYFARKNDVLVFEDLNELGYQQINKHKSLNYETLIVVVKCLAKFHSCSLIFEEKMSEKTKKQFRMSDVYAQELQEIAFVKTKGHIGDKAIQSLIKGVKTHIDLFPDPKSTISAEDFKRKAVKIYGDLMYVLCEPSKKYRNVICHGDLWASNILLKHEDGKPVHAKLVDFQAPKKCPPAQDLLSCIYLTTSRKFRSNYLNEVIDVYHKELDKCLQTFGYDIELIVPHQEFLESCEYYKTFAIAQTISLFQFVMTTSEDMAKLFKDDKLCHNAFYVDRSEFIVKMCQQNPQYKVVLNECLKDFRDLCETINI